jgi:hypothetical protein
MNNSNARPATALVAMALLLAAGASQAQTYKWVDDKGVVHYGDRVPPEFNDKANSVMNRQGVTTGRTGAAPTAEEIQQREARAAREREIAQAEQQRRRKDLALLNSYESEAEIDVLKGRAVRQVEQSITLIKADLDGVEKKRAKLEAERAGYTANPPPERLTRALELNGKEIARQKAAIAAREKEIAQITAKYDADKARYLEVRARQAAEAEARTGDRTNGRTDAATQASAAAPTTPATPTGAGPRPANRSAGARF